MRWNEIRSTEEPWCKFILQKRIPARCVSLAPFMECTLIHTYRTLFYDPNKLKIILESHFAVAIIKETEGDILNVTQQSTYSLYTYIFILPGLLSEVYFKIPDWINTYCALYLRHGKAHGLEIDKDYTQQG